MIDVSTLNDEQKNTLVENRWTSSEKIWDTVQKIYKQNTAIYANESEWLQALPERRRRFQIQSNRVFVNMEAVINSLIAEPPGINILPGRDGTDAQEFARKLERFFRKKFYDLNIKEDMRMGLRNLYFGRLIVIKPFWNPLIGIGGDFDFRPVDPRKVRFGKYARKEIDTEFAIEEIEDNLMAVCERFPKKKDDLMKKFAITSDADLYIKNPEVKYKEAWIGDWVVFKIDNIILDTIKNPYWDWQGILVTEEEEQQLNNANIDERRSIMLQAKIQQPQRQQEQLASQQQSQQSELNDVQQDSQPQTSQEPTLSKYKSYFYNYFDMPRKPYIFATVFNNENSPIGRTDMITLSSELQRSIDKRKMDIDENCEFMNGILKVDAAVMGKSDAQRIRFETKGIIWGKGVKDGVTREVGQALPAMVFEDMQDSRNEIDNIMAATDAFKGQRDGEETKGGRLALVHQSYLRLNELVQVTDFVSKEIFSWGMQLAKCRYTEYHYAKWMGKDDAEETFELIQDDFENGSEVVVSAGKTLPVDDEFKYQQAQNDVEKGYISPVDYLEIADYDNAKDLAKNAFLYKVAPASQFKLTPEEQQEIPQPPMEINKSISYDELPAAAKVQFLANMNIKVTEDQIQQEGVRTPVSIGYKDLSPDLQAQVASQQGWQANPQILVAEKMAEQNAEKQSATAQNTSLLASAHATLNPPQQKEGKS